MAHLFRFLCKSKFMRKLHVYVLVVLINYVVSSVIVGPLDCKLSNKCQNGVCRNNVCECDAGWKGKFCQFCSGRVRSVA